MYEGSCHFLDTADKTIGDLGDCEKLHRYLVAYNTDATMAGSAFRSHYANDFEPSMIFSLDHNVWMHQHEMRADQWMLFENTSTVAGRGRAFTTGKLWSEDGIPYTELYTGNSSTK
ncbi:hypothetical protein OESDEN_12207 [Oesophagostomum dentatum]|uniref:Acyl-CoA thioesterase-like C-terminal domain-containing protein n=1 Tax=Oesophagostomum dentatum TaxID=61180 RepID=A0A0B1SSS2_OESDE|nr:hypothetical protein OESDEN_12207 [Oesophagostomum dentatum]